MATLVTLALLVAGVAVHYNAAIAVLVLVGTALVLATLYDPYWGVVASVVALTVIPMEFTYNSFCGHNIGNPLQMLMPLVLGLCLLSALKSRGMPKPIWPDLLIIGLGILGLVSLLYAGHVPMDTYWKKYGNKIIYPMGLYFMVRLVPLDHEKLVRLIKISLVAVAVQAVIMVLQDRAGASPFYSTHNGRATGPFGYIWTAAAYMAMWPALFIYVAATAESGWKRWLSFLGLLLTAYAVTRTGERAATVLLMVVAVVCLMAPKTRSAAGKALIIGALAYVPWSMTPAGSALLSRFDQTDESRVAYRQAAFATLSSPQWHPLVGIGPYRGAMAMRQADVSHLEDTQVLLWGRTERSVAEVAQRGSALHNVYIALLLEFGVLGALLALGLAISLFGAVLRIGAEGRRDARVDRGLAVALLGAIVVWGGIGYVQNVYSMTAPMGLFFLWYGVLVGHPQAFLRSEPRQAVANDHAEHPARTG
ncbi:MAG: hypothetical protein ACP5KN_03685 [Armatimonadota bacterium]